MSEAIFAYLAGAMDSDGYFGIRHSSYHRRVTQDAVNDQYYERIGLQQVTPEIPNLLQSVFRGHVRVSKGQTANSKPLYCWQCTNVLAAQACTLLLPYLRVKKAQALVLLELRESYKPGYGQPSYWFVQENPHWRDMEMITTSEAVKILGYGHRDGISQCLRNKTLVALPYDYQGKETPRIPKALVEQLVPLRTKNGQGQLQPPQLVAWRRRLCETISTLNKIGLNGTHPNHRTGYYARKE
jgi:hypothetical protein